MNAIVEKRQQARYRCRSYATISADGNSWTGHLLNIGLGGALVAILHPYSFKPRQFLHLRIALKSKERFSFSGKVIHLKEHYIGIAFDALSKEEEKRLRMELESGRETVIIETGPGSKQHLHSLN